MESQMLLLSAFISEITNNHCWHLQVEKKSQKAKKYLIPEKDRMSTLGCRQPARRRLTV